MSRLIALVVVAGLLTGAGFGLYRLIRPQFKSWVEQEGPAAPTTAGPAAPQPRAQHLIDFTLKDLSGHEQTVTRWKGKLILLNFWAPWCTPCRQEIPMLESLQTRYGKRGLQIVGLGMDRPRSVGGYAKSAGINYPVLVGSMNKLARLGEAYGDNQQALPYSVLIDRRGRIVARWAGELKRARAMQWIKGRLQGSHG